VSINTPDQSSRATKKNNFSFFPSNTCNVLFSSPSTRARTENYKPWETEQEEGETGEDSGEDSEDVVTAVTAEGAEEVTVSILCIHRFTRHSKTHRSSFPPRGEIWRVRSNL